MAAPAATGTRSWVATAQVAGSACCFGAIPVFAIIATRAGASFTTILSGRYVIAAAVLLVMIGGVRAARLPRSQLLPLFVIGGLGQALVTFFGLKALDYISAATAGFLFYTYPAWLALFAAARGTEPLTTPRVVALISALLGVTLMIGSPWSATLNITGVLLSLTAGVLYACYVPLIRHAQHDVEPGVASIWISLGAALIYVTIGAVRGTLAMPADIVPGVGSILVIALVSTVLGFSLFLRGLRQLGPVRTAITSTVEPFFTAVLAAVMLAQQLTVMTFAGGVMIAGAVVLLQMESSRPPRTRARPPVLPVS